MRDGAKTTPPALVQAVLPRLRAALPDVQIGVGTDAYFAEVNRQAPASGDFLAFCATPQVHADDDRTVLENTAALSDVVRSARLLAAGRAVHVSPLTLARRRNPDATGPAAPMPPDPRLAEPFGTAWLLASLARLTDADSITACETTGAGGLVENGRPRPLYHVLRTLHGDVLPCESSDPGARRRPAPAPCGQDNAFAGEPDGAQCHRARGRVPCPAALCICRARGKNMTVGIGSYTFGWAVQQGVMDEMGLLTAAAELGVALVQVADNLPLHTFSPERLETFAAAAQGFTLELGARGLTRSHLESYIALCRRFGSGILRFVVDDGDYQPTPQEVIALLRDALPLLADGPTIALENHDRFSVRTLRCIVDEIGSVRVGICLDTANSLGAGEGLREACDVLAPVTVNLHVKDFAIARVPYLMGFTVEGRPAGQGQADLPFVRDALLPFARCRTVICELWTPPQPTVAQTLVTERAWAHQSVEYLKQVLSRPPKPPV